MDFWIKINRICSFRIFSIFTFEKCLYPTPCPLTADSQSTFLRKLKNLVNTQQAIALILVLQVLFMSWKHKA
jgi:hypothetical protein